MLELPNVTLIAVSSVNINETAQALWKSAKHIKFNSVKFVTDANVEANGLEFVKIPKIKTIDEYSKFMVYDLGDHIQTDFALIVQYDGWVTNPDSWDNEFLNYDYIGAPWPIPPKDDNITFRDPFGNVQRVGNGGFSLRSKKLIDLPKKLNLEWKPYFGFYNEDGFIAIHNRHILKQNGCNFAPLELAARFSREHTIPENEHILKPFGFHKIFH
jgi:hypothetical protein